VKLAIAAKVGVCHKKVNKLIFEVYMIDMVKVDTEHRLGTAVRVLELVDVVS
jgi:hypothetical protein